MIVVAALYGTSPVVTNGDSYLAFPAAVSLVHQRNLDLDEFDVAKVQDHYGVERHRGHAFDSYPWAVELFAVPAVLAVDGLHVLGLTPSATELVLTDRMGAVQLVTASLVTAFVALFVFLIAYERLTGPEARRRRLATMVALVFATATAAWSTASRALWQHGPSMLLLAVVVLLAARIERDGGSGPTVRAAGLGAAVAVATAIRPTNVIVAALLCVWMARRHRAQLVRFVAGGIAVAAVWLSVNLLTFGTLISDYNSPGRRLVLHSRYLEAVAANFVSTGRGLLVFSPVVLLAVVGLVISRRGGDLSLLDGVFAASVVLQALVVAASREAWWAGHSFGPRFMSDVLPLLAYLALPAVDVAATWQGVKRIALVAAVVWSVAVNAQGAYLHAANCWNVTPVDVDANPERVWSLSDPQVIAGWRAFASSPKHAATGGCASTGS